MQSPARSSGSHRRGNRWKSWSARPECATAIVECCGCELVHSAFAGNSSTATTWKDVNFGTFKFAAHFVRWSHTHRMTPEGPKSCRLEDRIEYELPLGFVGNLLGSWFVHKKLQKLFRHRHNVTEEAMAERRSKSEPRK